MAATGRGSEPPGDSEFGMSEFDSLLPLPAPSAPPARPTGGAGGAGAGSRILGGDSLGSSGGSRGGEAPAATMGIKLRCSDGTTHEVEVDPFMTIKQIIAQLQEKPLAKTVGKRVRMIHSGRVLRDTMVLRDSGVEEGHCLHVIVSDIPAPSAPSGEDLEAGGTPTVLGFDRLLAVGLDAGEVVAIRTMFSAEVAELVGHVPAQPGEEAHAHFRRVEDVWMAHQGPDSEFALNMRARLGPRADEFLSGTRGAAGMRAGAGAGAGGAPPSGDGPPEDQFLALVHRAQYEASEVGPREGTVGDFVWGYLLGFTLGFLMLFWAAQRFVPRKQKMGIVTGVLCNLLLTAMRQQNDTTTQ